MKASILSTTALLAATVTALPATTKSHAYRTRDNTQLYATANLVAHNQGMNEQTSVPLNVTIGVLYSNPAITAITSISLEGAETNVPNETLNVDNVVCQRYKDQWALQPGSVAFGGQGGVADISTNPVALGWILCYTVESQS